jgi:inhibitor of cysteine peptidase
VGRANASTNGGSEELKPGQELEVTLEGNATTGYLWDVSAIDETILRQVGAPRIIPAGSADGAGGQFVFRFAAVVAGQARLELVYRRPWEKDVAPADTFAIQVKVTG